MHHAPLFLSCQSNEGNYIFSQRRKTAVDSSGWGWTKGRRCKLNRMNNEGSKADSANQRGTSTSVDEDGNRCDIREVGGSKGRHTKSARVTLCVSSSASLCRPWPRGRKTWHTKASMSTKEAIFYFFFSRCARVEDHTQLTACSEISICCLVVCYGHININIFIYIYMYMYI